MGARVDTGHAENPSRAAVLRGRALTANVGVVTVTGTAMSGDATTAGIGAKVRSERWACSENANGDDQA